MKKGSAVFSHEWLFPYQFPYWIVHFPGQLFRALKYSFQRVHKGYCDRDTWNIDMWFLEVMPDMLKELRDHQNGYPAEFENEEDWNEVLDQMILYFREASEETCSKKNPIDFDEVVKHPNNKRLHEKWAANTTALDKYRDDCLQKGMALFSKYLRNLWD